MSQKQYSSCSVPFHYIVSVPYTYFFRSSGVFFHLVRNTKQKLAWLHNFLIQTFNVTKNQIFYIQKKKQIFDFFQNQFSEAVARRCSTK